MPHLLKDIKVEFISLVKAGANGKQIIFKSKDKDFDWDKEIKIAKRDMEKGIVYGIVYSPEEVDSQGDFTTKEEIEKAAYEFMKNLNLHNVDKDHDFQKRDAFVCESWIVRKDDPLFPDEKEGSWAVGIKLESEELKEAVQKGEIQGISMAGEAVREKVEKQDEPERTFIEKMVEAIKKAFKPENKETKEIDMGKYAEDIGKAIKEAIEPIMKEKIADIEKKNEEAMKKIEELESELKKSSQKVTVDKHNDKIEEVLV